MINSGLRLISVFLLVFFFKVLLCYPAENPHPRNHLLNGLRCSRGNVNKESSFTAVQLGSDPKDSQAGGRLEKKDADK